MTNDSPADLRAWLANSETQRPQCVTHPGTLAFGFVFRFSLFFHFIFVFFVFVRVYLLSNV